MNTTERLQAISEAAKENVLRFGPEHLRTALHIASHYDFPEDPEPDGHFSPDHNDADYLVLAANEAPFAARKALEYAEVMRDAHDDLAEACRSCEASENCGECRVGTARRHIAAALSEEEAKTDA